MGKPPSAGCRRLRAILVLVATFAGIEASPPGPAATAAALQGEEPLAGGAEELKAADRRFAAAVAAARGADRADAWTAWFAVDGCQIVPGAVVSGHAAIRELMAPAFADTTFALRWEPDLAEGTADRGWTSGRYVSIRRGADGPVRREGRYLTCWRRVADGSWKVAVDTGVPDGD
jgi:ketosteroid isomerase-like protein